ncbi:MAG: endolytic transglycosylase MltG, partial [Pseudomonadota bacterium]
QIVQQLQDASKLCGDIVAIPPEGSMMPDTYQYVYCDQRMEIIERMQDEQRRFLEEDVSPPLPDPLLSVNDLVILASIVEKESATEQDKVAGVFINRLRANMRLQSDPTVIYGITQGFGVLDRPLRRSDLRVQSAHNTYLIRGLPPTPIANPSRAAILATLRPQETSALYFVADGERGHVFSETLREHNKNVAAYRQRLAEQAQEAQNQKNTQTSEDTQTQPPQNNTDKE